MRLNAAIVIGGILISTGWLMEAAIKAEERIAFETERERVYWDMLNECNTQLEVEKRLKLAEVSKVRTATLTCNLTCPPIPACPACACESSTLTHVVEIGGGLALGVLIGGGIKSCPQNVIVSP